VVRSPEIQGLRAFAVALVLLFHAGWLPGGYIGVDVFYVISGYLITSLIIDDHEFSFSKFYSRRAKRLLPVAFFVLFVTAIAFWLIAPSGSRGQFAKDLLASSWYVSNYLYAHWQNDYQNLGATPSPLIHYWSLAVEEQFYLFWPLLLIFFKSSRKLLVPVITLASFVLSITLVESSPIFAFYSLPTRAFELGVGSIIALYPLRAKMIWPGMIAIFAGALIFDAQTPFPAFPALLPIGGAALVLISLKRNVLLSNPIALKIGDWSYSIYLWHWPLLTIPPIFLQRDLGDKERVFALAVCIALSAITYNTIENPIRKSDLSKSKIAIGSLVGTLLLSALSFGISAAATTSKFNLDKPKIYANGCHQGYSGSHINEKCIFGDVEAKSSIVLLGDSHAAQWFPAIDSWAKKRNYRLYTFTKSSCPALQIPLRDNGGFKASDCVNYRAEALAAIKRIKPILVVLGNFEHYKVSASEYVKADKYDFNHLLIRDTPWPNRDIPVCLSKSDKCDTDLPELINYRSTQIFDPTPLLCNETCPAIVDGILAYRDQTHITVDMANHLAPALSAKLDSLVAG
jgi:peptidoglycan/LPS O-acetylase OafA/YrhL